jgi:hypothetical protein
VSIKNLENQVGQIATTLTSRPNGSFPSTTETLTSTSIDKGKETCKVIHLRSGNEYEGLIMGTLVTKEPQRRPVDDRGGKMGMTAPFRPTPFQSAQKRSGAGRANLGVWV